MSFYCGLFLNWVGQINEYTQLAFLDFFPALCALLALFSPYSISKSSLYVYYALILFNYLLVYPTHCDFAKKPHPTHLFGPVLVYEFYIKYPLCSFILAYLFNWNLRLRKELTFPSSIFSLWSTRLFGYLLLQILVANHYSL